MAISAKHSSKASNRSQTPGLFGSGRYTFLDFPPTLSHTSVAYMLIAVAILLALAIVYKHVAKPSWIPSSQQLSEKFRLYMAGSMIGDFTRWIFNAIWTKSRQDTVVVSNRDEKSKRLSLDMSSSSSTSLSPTVPRLYKKTSNSRLTSHRRSSLRQKTQPQNIPASLLSPIEDNPSSNNDSHNEQSSMFTEQDEAKSSVTIHVVDTLNSRTDQSSVESKEVNDNYFSQNSSDTMKRTNEKLESNQDFIQDENIDSWAESQQTPAVILNRYDKSRRLTADLTFSESSMSSTNNGSPKSQKRNSKGNRKQNARSKEQTAVSAAQESDGEIDSIISDNSDQSLIQQSEVTVPTIQKHVQDSKTRHRRRRRRTRGSKSNQQKAQQNQQNQQIHNSDQRSLKQQQPVFPQKQDISQQNASNVPKSRHYHSDEISKSHQVVERYPHQHAESNQSSRSDQTGYFLQANKRTGQIYHSANLNVPATEPNRKAVVFPRTDIHWKQAITTSSHTSTTSQNFNPAASSNVPISRSTYADVIALHNRPSALPRSNNSGLSNGNNTPDPAVSMNNTTNNKLYSPFGSGLSIQLTPPASPRDIHRNLPSTNSNTSNSIYSSRQSQDRNRNVIAPPPSISASNNESSFSSSPSSSLSMFTSSPFSSLSNPLSNSNQSSVIKLFGRKNPVQDQEKGELSDGVDDSENWNKMIGISEGRWVRQNGVLPVRKGKFSEKIKNESFGENVCYREQQSQQQFSLFKFMYPPRS